MKKIVAFFCVVAIVLFFQNPCTAQAEELPPADQPVAEISIPTEPVIGPPAVIIVYRKSNICGVHDAAGNLIRAMTVSTGREGHETPLGNFTIYQHSTGSGYHPMVDGTYGRWCMRFKKGGYMFHSVCYAHKNDAEPIAEEVEALGTSVSRGCVRLTVEDAEWMYNNIPDGCLVTIIDE